MSATLKQKTLSSIKWSGAEAVARQGLMFVTSVAMARLLSPEDFGVLGMLMLFAGIASVFVDGGMSAAIIQKKNLTQEESSSAFFLNMIMGLVMASLLAAAAPWIAGFYHLAILRRLTQLMALNIFISSLGSVQWALMAKDLDFKTQMQIAVASLLVSGVTAITLACSGCGVWSLAAQMLVQTTVSTALAWHLRAWRPILVFRWAALRGVMRFGLFIFLAGLADAIASRVHTLLIGRLYSPQDLGYYTRADSTQQLPSTTLAVMVNRVTFPVFSLVSDDKQRLRRAVREALTAMVLLNTPALLGIAVTANALVLTLFGRNWLPCVPYLRILCLAGLFLPFHVANLSPIKATGNSAQFFKLEIIKKTILLLGVILSAWISVTALAWSQVVINGLCFIVNARWTQATLGYSAILQLRDTLPISVAGLLMSACSWAVSMHAFRSPAVELAAQVATGAIVYITCCHVFKVSSYHLVLEHFKASTKRPRPVATAS